MNQAYYIAAPILLIALYIGASLLWNKKYRPWRRERGIPTDKFAGAFKRLTRFVFREDKQPIIKKISNPKVQKWVTWNNFYILSLLATVGVFALNPLQAWIPFLIFIIPIITRAPGVFKARQKTLNRMLTVANSVFHYGRGAELEPWSYVNVKKWTGYTTPGETVITFPASWMASPMSQDSFENHFSQTVTEDNTWVYTWSPAKGQVVMKPVGHIPTQAPYPGSADRPWNEIPLGLGAGGEIVWDVTKSPHALVAGKSGGGKSVAQRTIVFHCIQHNDKWCFLGVDPKKVELKPYAKYKNTVMGIGTTLEDMVEIIRYAKEEMMRRYEAMEELEVNHFGDLPDPPRAIMLMVDEAYMLMATEGVKTDQGKENDQLHGEASTLIGEILRLGRAAGVHITLAMQRPDATVLKGEFKNNLEVRIAAGRLDSTPSAMVLDSGLATRVPSNIKGRGVASMNGDQELYQGYFASQDWINDWLLENPEREPDVVDWIRKTRKVEEPVAEVAEDLSGLADFDTHVAGDDEDEEFDSTLSNDDSGDYTVPDNVPDAVVDMSRIDESEDFLPDAQNWDGSTVVEEDAPEPPAVNVSKKPTQKSQQVSPSPEPSKKPSVKKKPEAVKPTEQEQVNTAYVYQEEVFKTDEEKLMDEMMAILEAAEADEASAVEPVTPAVPVAAVEAPVTPQSIPAKTSLPPARQAAVGASMPPRKLPKRPISPSGGPVLPPRG